MNINKAKAIAETILKAGSKKVYEVHGNLEEGYCIGCGSKVTFDFLIGKILNNEFPPRCGRCSGVLRPNIYNLSHLYPVNKYLLNILILKPKII